jgi:putative hydrolases of HD superfamily
MDCANIIEHSYRVVWIALILARKIGNVNEEKLMKIALAHDIAETRVSDLSYVQKVYTKADEEAAMRDILAETSFPDFEQLIHEYEQRESLESKIVKDADNLDIDLEMRELEERGSKLPAKWKSFRDVIRNEKLYTEAAKELWDALQTADVADWHIATNKWVKIPEAGR